VAAAARGSRGGALHRGAADAPGGLEGVRRGTRRRTTIPDAQADRPTDLVARDFSADRPNRLWVGDFYVMTWSGVVYVAFVIDAFSRRIVGWRADTNMRTELVLDTLEMALWSRDRDEIPLAEGMVCHNDAESQHTSFACTARLVQAGVDPSVGSVGDAYDNAPQRPRSASTRPRRSTGAAHGRRWLTSRSRPSSGPPADEDIHMRVVQQRRHLLCVLRTKRLQPYLLAEQSRRVGPVAEAAHQAGASGAAAVTVSQPSAPGGTFGSRRNVGSPHRGTGISPPAATSTTPSRSLTPRVGRPRRAAARLPPRRRRTGRWRGR
jgi:Integrase core domain